MPRQQTNGLLPDRRQIRLLLKLFSDDYTGRGIGLRNWRLYHELNARWIPRLIDRLGRLPTPTLHAIRRTVEASTEGLLPALRTEWELQEDLVDRGHLAEGARAFFAGEEPDFSASRRG